MLSEPIESCAPIDEDEVTREMVRFILTPEQIRRLREAMRRARADGARNDAAALMCLVEAFHASSARRLR